MNTWFGTKNITHSLDFVVCALINLPQSENVRTIGGKKWFTFSKIGLFDYQVSDSNNEKLQQARGKNMWKT